MNEVLKCLKERRSVRKYRSEQIKDSELEQILEAGTYAPTGMGMQSPIMVAVQDPETIAKLSKMNAAVMGVTSDPFYGAPTVIVVLADRSRGTYVEDGKPCDGQSDECGLFNRRRFLLDPSRKGSL